MPENRVTLDGDGNVHLAYRSTNDEEADRLYDELKRILNHIGMAEHHVLRKNFYMHMDIARRRRAPTRRAPAASATDPATSVLDVELQGARARQPLRRRHQLLPEHRRGEPGAHRDGQRDPRRRAPRRAPRLTAPTHRTTTKEQHSMSLKGKVAIVTGGNSGIGKAIALALAAEGANIVIDYVADEAGRPRSSSARSPRSATESIGVEADVSKVADLQRLVDAAVKAFGRLDIMVNNAGVETRTSILDTTEEQYEKVMEINLKSAFFGTQIAAKQMIAQGGGGRIINITSVHEDWPMPGNTAVLPVEGRDAHADPHRRGRARPARRHGGRRRAGRGRHADQHLDDGRPGEDEDARRRDPVGAHGRARARSGGVVAFLASDGASYLTATTMFADGGIMHSSPGL